MTFSRGALEVNAGKSRITAFDASIGSVQFSPRFFKEADPDFSPTFASRKYQLILNCWKVVINNHWGKNPVNKEVYKIYSSGVSIFGNESCFNISYFFSQSA